MAKWVKHKDDIKTKIYLNDKEYRIIYNEITVPKILWH